MRAAANLVGGNDHASERALRHANTPGSGAECPRAVQQQKRASGHAHEAQRRERDILAKIGIAYHACSLAFVPRCCLFCGCATSVAVRYPQRFVCLTDETVEKRSIAWALAIA